MAPQLRQLGQMSSHYAPTTSVLSEEREKSPERGVDIYDLHLGGASDSSLTEMGAG